MALQALLKDSCFQIPSDSAKEARLAASEMLEWLATPDNAALATAINPGIMAALSKCIPQGTTHHQGLSVRLWICLKQLSIGKSASSIFYQYITDVLFKTMKPMTYQAHDVPPLDYQESKTQKPVWRYRMEEPSICSTLVGAFAMELRSTASG